MKYDILSLPDLKHVRIFTTVYYVIKKRAA